MCYHGQGKIFRHVLCQQQVLTPPVQKDRAVIADQSCTTERNFFFFCTVLPDPLLKIRHIAQYTDRTAVHPFTEPFIRQNLQITADGVL